MGHVHFMLFMSISFASGTKRKLVFQWNMGLRIANFILGDDYLPASRLCMGKAHLKIRYLYHKRGLGLIEFQ